MHNAKKRVFIITPSKGLASLMLASLFFSLAPVSVYGQLEISEPSDISSDNFTSTDISTIPSISESIINPSGEIDISVDPGEVKEVVPVKDPPTDPQDPTEDIPDPVDPKDEEEEMLTQSTITPIDSLTEITASLKSRLSPGIDDVTGALIYKYAIIVPPGRGSLTPDLSLVYNSAEATGDSIIGSGWSFDIPSIQRINKTGSNNLYSEDYYSSSFSGELIALNSTDYIARTEKGDFFTYEKVSDGWVVTDKQGTQYIFGENAQARQDNSSNSSQVFKWMLEEVRDTNDNYITYEYYKDTGQIYPLHIGYTGNGTTDGIFEINFVTDTRSGAPTSYATGFLVQSNYFITEINTEVDSTWARKYTLDYTTADNSTISLLDTILEEGQDASNNVSSLPIVDFDYHNATTGWTYDSAMEMPFPFLEAGVDYGMRTADVNGDGLMDILCHNDKTNGACSEYNPEIYINNGAGWTDMSSTWLFPVRVDDPTKLEGFLDASDDDSGLRAVDVNGDHKVDLVRGMGTDKYIYINNGTGWTYDSGWVLPLPFIDSSGLDYGMRMEDINGDGLPDIVCHNEQTNGTCSRYNPEVYLNNGTGWSSSGWDFPYKVNDPTKAEVFVDSSLVDAGLRLLDVNGDGLTDMVRAYGTTFNYAYINTGSAWVYDSSWSIPQLGFTDGGTDYGFRMQDINGDGLIDILCHNEQTNGNCSKYNPENYLGTGTGWTSAGWGYPYKANDPTKTEVFLNSSLSDTGLRVLDINGDGFPDLVRGYDSTFKYSYINNESTPTNLLEKISYSQGGITEITYKTTPLYNDGTNLLNPSLPISVTTVESITTDDGLGTTGTNTYSYEDGHYFYDTPSNRKFAGFGVVTKEDAVGNVIKTYYHQGNGDTSSTGEANDSEFKIGKPYLVEQYDDSSNLYKTIINVWDEDLTNRNFVFLSEKITLDSDGNNSVHKDSAEEFTYDNSNGNLLTHVEYGEGAYSSGSFSDTGTDDRTTTYLYVTGSSNNVIGMPYSEITTDNSSTVIKETQYHYDGQSFGSVTLGNVTDIYKLISGSTYSHEQKMYDIGMGLLTDFIDANSKTTLYNYDTYSLYPIEITDGNSNVTRFDYDYSSGKVAEKVDPSSNVWTTIYDGLDRATEEIVPAPSSSQVTKARYIYDDVNIPNSVTKLIYLDSSLSTESITYIDGLGRTIQERSEGESDYSVIDTIYDDNGRIWKKSLPYFDSGSTNTTATTNPDLYTENIYDPLGRVISITNAVGTTEYAYDQWKTTVTDANNHDKSFYKDAHNNLVQVDEDDGNGIASTYYDWDMLGNLINITDALGNVRNFTYDNLSRRLTAEDLHDPLDTYFGTWTYAYDDVGNLATVTDPNSNYITYTYDGINRILTEDLSSSTGTDISYTYGGGCTNGADRLCSVVLLSGDGTDYDYDEVGNVVLEDKTISAMSNDTIFTYDYQNNITSITDSYSNLTEYTYNSAGRIENIDYTPNGGSSQGIIDNFDYSPIGQITEQEQSNGVTITNTYNQNQLYRLNQKVTTDGTTLFQDIRYLYDPVGNIIEIEENSTLDSGRIANYEYDWLNRLLQAEITATANSQDYTQVFRYDALGNIVQKDLDTYDYDGNTSTLFANPHAVTSIGIIGYSYDNSGNLVNDGTFTYAWNYKNQMTQAASVGVTADYTYDENGQRTSTTSGGIFTIYPNKYLDMDVNYSRSHVYAGDQLVATIDQGGVHYNSPDHLNSSAVITDSSGNLEQLLDYYPYGGVRLNNQAASFNERNKYIGQEFDEETGLNYMNARYQNSSIGKFTSQDPVFIEIGVDKRTVEVIQDPQMMNSYSYARNNPLAYVDPKGEFAMLAPAILAIASFTPQITSFAQSLMTPIGQYGLSTAINDTQQGNYGWAAVGALSAGEFSGGKAIVNSIETTKDVASFLNKGSATTDVYLGMDKGKDVYVGISKNTAAREAQHGNRFSDGLDKMISLPTRNQARAIEQSIIDTKSSSYQNIRNSISSTNPSFGGIKEWASNFLKNTGLNGK